MARVKNRCLAVAVSIKYFILYKNGITLIKLDNGIGPDAVLLNFQVVLAAAVLILGGDDSEPAGLSPRRAPAIPSDPIFQSRILVNPPAVDRNNVVDVLVRLLFVNSPGISFEGFRGGNSTGNRTVMVDLKIVL